MFVSLLKVNKSVCGSETRGIVKFYGYCMGKSQDGDDDDFPPQEDPESCTTMIMMSKRGFEK